MEGELLDRDATVCCHSHCCPSGCCHSCCGVMSRGKKDWGGIARSAPGRIKALLLTVRWDSRSSQVLLLHPLALNVAIT
jgi:hypothetical protein